MINSIYKRYAAQMLSKKVIGICITLLILGSCSEKTVDTHFYFLEPPVYAKQVFSGKFKHTASLLFKKAEAVAPYNTTNFVVKIRSSEVRFYNYAKWIAPPHEMLSHYFLRSLIFSNLAEVVKTRVGQRNTYYLELEVQEFGQSLEAGIPQGIIKIFIGMRHVDSKTYNWYKVYQVQELASSLQPYDIVVALNKGIGQINQNLLVDIDNFLLSQN